MLVFFSSTVVVTASPRADFDASRAATHVVNSFSLQLLQTVVHMCKRANVRQNAQCALTERLPLWPGPGWSHSGSLWRLHPTLKQCALTEWLPLWPGPGSSHSGSLWRLRHPTLRDPAANSVRGVLGCRRVQVFSSLHSCQPNVAATGQATVPLRIGPNRSSTFHYCAANPFTIGVPRTEC